MLADYARCFAAQDRKAVEKKKEQDKAKEKQQEELSKQRQIEKVNFDLAQLIIFCQSTDI